MWCGSTRIVQYTVGDMYWGHRHMGFNVRFSDVGECTPTVVPFFDLNISSFPFPAPFLCYACMCVDPWVIQTLTLTLRYCRHVLRLNVL